MTVLLLWLARFFILYFILKMVFSAIRRLGAGAQKSPKKQTEKPRRFNAADKQVAEGDFKDL